MSHIADQTLDVSSNVLQAKRSNEQQLLQRQGVRSVGIGADDQGNEVIAVGVEQQEQQAQVQSAVPDSIQGVPTDVRVVGDIVPQQRQGRVRPVPQGVSVGHPNVTAGTVGWMYQTGDGTIYIGSNNHVIANSNAANDGDPTLQPGTADGGTTDDQIGTLAFYVPITGGVDVDLAIAEMTQADITNALEGIPDPIVGVVSSLTIGEQLTKSGRTTGVTTGSIQQLDASVNVNYGGNLGTVNITGCIMTGAMSDGGDSGSSVARQTSQGLEAAGRLFAGSSSTTVHSHILNEISHLQNDFDSSIALLLSDGGGGGEFAIDGPEEVVIDESNQWSVLNVPTDADSIEWSFGDGSTATGEQVSHTYTSTGSFTITAEAIGPGGSTVASTSVGV